MKKILKNKTNSILILIIAIITFGVYFNALSGEFVYDDLSQIVENPLIKDTSNILNIFFSDVWSFEATNGSSNYYRPLMHISNVFVYKIFGLNSFWFHLVNILFHVGVSVLVFLLSSFLLKKVHEQKSNLTPISNKLISFTAALLFVTHPIHTEAVAWIAALPEVAFTFLVLVSLYLYVTKTKENYNRNYRLSIFCFFIATLFKETALILPILVIAYDFAIRGNRLKDLKIKYIFWFKKYLPYFVASFVYLGLRLYSLGSFTPQGPRHADLSFYEYVINIFPLFSQYLEKLILPINLNAHYILHPISSILELRNLIVIAIFIVYGLLLYVSYRQYRIVFFSLFWIAITLLPVLWIPVLGENTFADRYLYFSSIGFVILISFALAKILEYIKKTRNYGLTKATYLAIFFVIFCFYGYGTVQRNVVWKDSFALWTDTVIKSPDSALAHDNLGTAYQDKGMYEQAKEEHQKALELDPSFTYAQNNLAATLVKQDKNDQAAEYLTDILENSSLTPENANMLSTLARSYEEKGEMQKAIEYFKKALELKPESYTAHNNLGIVFYKEGLVKEAKEEFELAAKINPDFVEARNNLTLIYLNNGQIEEAIKNLEDLVASEPDEARVYFNLGYLYQKQNLNEKAIEYYKIALEMDGNLMEARERLTELYKVNIE